MDIVYIATPYKSGPDRAKFYADRASALHIMKGDIVFSPVSQNHDVANHMPNEVRTDNEVWLPQCLYWLAQCTLLHVVCDSDHQLEISEGCQEEIKFCEEHKIPIIKTYYHEL